MPNYGATPSEWDHLSLGLGLTADLLPVVSNPNAEISPDSKMQGVGKTPSRYNKSGKAVGIPEWTSYHAALKDISRWQQQPDYGICLQTRTVRAIDIDVEDAELSSQIARTVAQLVGPLPTRYRTNSGKCLLAFSLPGDLAKRVIRMEGGIIEFLATGQQFIACGTHTSGARYEWQDGLPAEIPELSLEQFEQLWAHLATTFGTEGSTISTSPSRSKVLADAISKDPIAQHLLDQGWVKSTERDGRLHITCPFEHEHTGPSAISATTYFPANTGGYQQGHFDCRHAHCEHRTDDDFKNAVEAPVYDPLDDFDALPPITKDTSAQAEPAGTDSKKTKRFQVIPAVEFASCTPQGWIVKGVIPAADLGVIYGESGSGKTFFITDLACAIARGTEWRGHRVKQGNVVYICAEGAGGMRSRLVAHSVHADFHLGDLPIGVIPDAPDFMQVGDVKAVIEAVRAFGPTSVIIVDTFAQVMAGANENAGEDVGKALAHCRALHKHTGALVLLVHHAGKDASKGARGWSGLRAACDVEIEVSRCEDDRVAKLTKLKDGLDGTEFGFKLKTVPVGMDEDGDIVSSCVVEYTDARPKAASKRQHGTNERLLLRCLDELVTPGDDTVNFDALIEATARNMSPPISGKRDRRAELAKRAVDALLECGDIVIDGASLKRANKDEREDDGSSN